MLHVKRSASATAALAALVLIATAGCSTLSATAESGSATKADAQQVAPAPTIADGAGAAPAAGSDDAAALSPAVQAQIDYVLKYWKNYNSAEYGVVTGNDCVNFASQSLIARGWSQDDDWYHAANVVNSSSSWRSSTAMRNWLASRPDLATALTDKQRDQVKVGDIVQFDWDNSGDRDHTGIVTKVEHDASGTKVYFAGHTNDSDYRDVDQAITVDHPGASVYYWSIAG